MSRVGQQCLYYCLRLRNPLADEAALHELDVAAALLAQQPRARGQALLARGQLTDDETHFLSPFA